MPESCRSLDSPTGVLPKQRAAGSIPIARYNDDWERLAWVLLRGRASLVTDAGEKAQAVAALRRKYPQYRTMALEERPLIRLEPERAASWGAVSE